MQNKLKLAVLFILLAASALLISYVFYRYLINYSALSQRDINKAIAQYFIALKDNDARVGKQIIFFSFLYGVVHAVGPGHGKAILTSYLVTHPSDYKQSLSIAGCMVMLQVLMALLIVSTIFFVLRLSNRYIKLSEQYLTQFSYVLLIAFGLYIAYTALKNIFYPSKHNGCKQHSHKHEAKLNQALDQDCFFNRHSLLILIGGIRPCNGSLLILIFTYSLGMYLWGIIAVFLVALGVFFSLGWLVTIVYCYRQYALKLIGQPHSCAWLTTGLKMLAFLLGLWLSIFGCFLLYCFKPTPLGFI